MVYYTYEVCHVEFSENLYYLLWNNENPTNHHDETTLKYNLPNMMIFMHKTLYIIYLNRYVAPILEQK